MTEVFQERIGLYKKHQETKEFFISTSRKRSPHRGNGETPEEEGETPKYLGEPYRASLYSIERSVEEHNLAV